MTNQRDNKNRKKIYQFCWCRPYLVINDRFFFQNVDLSRIHWFERSSWRCTPARSEGTRHWRNVEHTKSYSSHRHQLQRNCRLFTSKPIIYIQFFGEKKHKFNGLQVHLEADPNLYEHDDSKYAALTKSDMARLEIFSDLLSTQLGLIVQTRDHRSTNMFPNAYFLGRHEVQIFTVFSKHSLCFHWRLVNNQSKTLQMFKMEILKSFKVNWKTF